MGHPPSYDPDDGDEPSGAIVKTASWVDLGPIVVDTRPQIDWIYWKTFARTFFTQKLNTGPGTCTGLFVDTVTAPIKQIQSFAKNLAPLIVPALQSIPAGAAWFSQQIKSMAAAGATSAYDARMALRVVGSASALATQAAPVVKSVTPYGIAAAFDGMLLYGLVREVKAGMNGKCKW